MLMNVLANALKTITNAENRGKRQVLVRPCSKVLLKFLSVMQKNGYIDDVEVIDNHRSGKVVVALNGRLNKCGCISHRFDISLPEIEQWSNKILPARGFGHLVLTTSYGILTHEECRQKQTGGKILGFFF